VRLRRWVDGTYVAVVTKTLEQQRRDTPGEDVTVRGNKGKRGVGGCHQYVASTTPLALRSRLHITSILPVRDTPL